MQVPWSVLVFFCSKAVPGKEMTSQQGRNLSSRFSLKSGRMLTGELGCAVRANYSWDSDTKDFGLENGQGNLKVPNLLGFSLDTIVLRPAFRKSATKLRSQLMTRKPGWVQGKIPMRTRRVPEDWMGALWRKR